MNNTKEFLDDEPFYVELKARGREIKELRQEIVELAAQFDVERESDYDKDHALYEVDVDRLSDFEHIANGTYRAKTYSKFMPIPTGIMVEAYNPETERTSTVDIAVLTKTSFMQFVEDEGPTRVLIHLQNYY